MLVLLLPSYREANLEEFDALILCQVGVGLEGSPETPLQKWENIV